MVYGAIEFAGVTDAVESQCQNHGPSEEFKECTTLVSSVKSFPPLKTAIMLGCVAFLGMLFYSSIGGLSQYEGGMQLAIHENQTNKLGYNKQSEDAFDFSTSPEAVQFGNVVDEKGAYGSSGKYSDVTKLNSIVGYGITDLDSSKTYHPTPSVFSSSEKIPSLNPTPLLISDDAATPTEKPTKFPTKMPSELPSESPTDKPSHKPSASPTTHKPSYIPSHCPSEAPSTHKPTHPPTGSESTPKPTHLPTSIESTSKPTHSPTQSPTEVSKTLKPTHTTTDSPTPKPTKTPTRSPTNSDTPSFTFTLARSGYSALSFFTDSNNIFQYKILENRVAIVEPYALNELVVFDGNDDDDGHYAYGVCNSETGDCVEGLKYPDDKSSMDVAIKVECNPHDELEVNVTYINNEGNSIAAMYGTAVCIHVRREIRDLTSADLDAALDAMYAMWSTSNDQNIYGADFHNSTYFTEAHHFNAAWQDSDHIHEGLGFLPQHLKLTNMFESSMQAVNPAVSLPYWDFTIENEAGLSIFESNIFQPGIFGSLKAPSNGMYWSYDEDSIEDGYISDGRWEGISSDRNQRFDDRLQNSFGFLRGPWNMNPSEKVTRFTSEITGLPGCSAYYQWASLDDMRDFLKAAPYLPHASLHGAIGGVFGCDMLDSMLTAGLILDEDSKVMLCNKWGFYLKELYRGNYISPNPDCSASSMTTDDIYCGFTCNSDYYDDMTSKMKLTINNAYMPKDMDVGKWELWRDFVCTGNGFRIFVGDQLESASPSDPSFWPIHPTQERLLHARLMSGGFDEFEWPTDPLADYICDKSQCFEDGAKDSYDECCYGHYEDDKLLDFVNGDKSSGFGLSNKQILLDTDPTSPDYAASYIYNDFTWSHCSSANLVELFSSLQQRRK